MQSKKEEGSVWHFELVGLLVEPLFVPLVGLPWRFALPYALLAVPLFAPLDSPFFAPVVTLFFRLARWP